MKCVVKKIIVWSTLMVSMPVTVLALAPVENASSQQDTIEHSAGLVPSTSQDQATPTDTAPTDTNTTSSQPANNDDSNNPLIGSATVTSDTAPTLQNPQISGGENSALSSLPLSARVARLEQQMQNIVHANVPQQVATLQQQIQQLSGELQVQQHDIKLLNQQLRNFYQGLSTQIKQMKNMSSSSDDSNTGSSTTSKSINSSLPSATVPVTAPEPSAVKKKVKTSFKAVTSRYAARGSDQYKTALNALMKKQYVQAAHGFQHYLTRYPNGRFVVNAHYWLGEIYVMQRRLAPAMKEFHTVISRYPRSNKVPDAKVKLAIIHASQGKLVQARDEFRRIKKQYPGKTAAQLATIQLQQLGQNTRG